MDEKELKDEKLESVGGGRTVDEDVSKPFYGLFAGADKLVSNDERKLVLPATTLNEG